MGLAFNPAFGPRACILTSTLVLKATKGTGLSQGPQHTCSPYVDPGRGWGPGPKPRPGCSLSLKAGPQVVLGICLLALTSSSMLAFKLPFPGSLEVQVSQWEALAPRQFVHPSAQKSRGSESSPPEPPLPPPATPPTPSHPAPPLPPQLPSGVLLPLQGSLFHRTTGSLVW